MRSFYALTCWLLFGLGILFLIGYLCHEFHQWWPVLLILALPTYHDDIGNQDNSDNSNNPNNETEEGS